MTHKMENKTIITIEQKRDIISHVNIRKGTDNGINIRWVVGVYEDIGFYPKHKYSKSFRTEQEAEDYKLKISQKNSKAKSENKK